MPFSRSKRKNIQIVGDEIPMRENNLTNDILTLVAVAPIIALLIFTLGCTPSEGTKAFSEDVLPAETPNANTIGGPIFIPTPPESFEVKKAGYGDGTAFKLRSEKPVSRVDIMVTYEPPKDSDGKQVIAENAMTSELNIYRNQTDFEIKNEIVPIRTELGSKIQSDFVLEVPDGVFPTGNQMLVRTVVFFDTHFFHIRIQADNQETLEILTNWALAIQYIGEPETDTDSQ